jgi:hypothetical protein
VPVLVGETSLQSQQSEEMVEASSSLDPFIERQRLADVGC